MHKCTKEKCTLEDFVFETKDWGNGLYSIINYEEYYKESNRPEHYFCKPVERHKKNEVTL